MQKSKIEWTDYTINPVRGLCPVACRDNQGKEYCYARRMYRRFNWNPEIRFDVQPLLDVEKIKKPSRIFVGSTIELFGEWVDAFWLDSIFRTVKDNPRHIFMFLTKQPQNLAKFSPFPANCWVGVTATNTAMLWEARKVLPAIKASIKFISFEPLLEKIEDPILHYLNVIADWVIIGAQTQPYKPPKLDWILDIVMAADKANIPVFLKNNLKLNPLGYYEVNWAFQNRKLRQEVPKE